jgi:hypothetical protein
MLREMMVGWRLVETISVSDALMSYVMLQSHPQLIFGGDRKVCTRIDTLLEPWSTVKLRN